MTKEFVQMPAFYSILSCVLAFLAIFLNSLFQPQLQWKVTLLESQGETSRLEYQGISTTSLFNMPRITANSLEGHYCSTAVYWVYVQNQLLQSKRTLEEWVNRYHQFSAWLAFLMVLNLVVSAIYVLKQEAGWGITFVIIVLVAICVIALITVFGPLKGGQFWCFAQIKAEAQLTNMSYDGAIYLFGGFMTDILAVVLLIARYFKYPKAVRAGMEISA